MEWFHEIEPVLTVSRVQEICTLAALPSLCADVYAVDEAGRMECVWGVFEARCLPLRHGVRYELASCPHALQWSIASRHGEMLLHASINLPDPDPDFADSIVAFLGKFRDALQARARAEATGSGFGAADEGFAW